MSFDLSILIPENSWEARESLLDKLEAIFTTFPEIDEVSYPSKMSDEYIMQMLETVMFPYYPNVKEQFSAFCVEKNYASEPLEANVAREFWMLMTARELASLSLRSHHEDSVVRTMYSELATFAREYNLQIFNPQAGELEDLNQARDYPRYWLEEE